MSIAFLFLLTNKLVHHNIWDKFFEKIDPNLYSIYSHIKIDDDTGNLIPKYISKNKIDKISTKWCDKSLVYAFANMVKEALQNKKNKYFILLSGECIPLYPFEYIYNNIFSDKRSRLYIYNFDDYYYNEQWMILNLYSAKKFINIENYDSFLDDMYYGINKHCPDEIFPIYYFIKILNKTQFNNNINNKIVTYTKWKKNIPHPYKFKLIDVEILKDEICNSNALFARKFYKNSANKIAMKC